jgi:hypothetical protein
MDLGFLLGAQKKKVTSQISCVRYDFITWSTWFGAEKHFCFE